jgi:WD40 repeat protein
MLTLAGPRRPTRALAFCPRTGRLAAAGDDHLLRVWQPPAPEPASTSSSCPGPLVSLAYHPAGSRVAAGTRGGAIVFWEPTSAQLEAHRVPSGGPAVCAAFTACGGAALGGLRSVQYDDDLARLVCVYPAPLPPVMLPWDGELEAAAFCPSRDLFALARPDRGLELWETLRPRREPIAWMPARVEALAFSPGDGRRLACAAGRVVELFDLDEPGRRLRCVGHRAVIEALAFAPGGRSLLSGGGDGVRLWDALCGRQLAAWDWGLGPVFAVAFAPDGMTAAAAGRKPGVVIWDIDEG